MRKHHTKNKGDLGVLYAQLDLAQRGYTLLLPLTEHAASTWSRIATACSCASR